MIRECGKDLPAIELNNDLARAVIIDFFEFPNVT